MDDVKPLTAKERAEIIDWAATFGALDIPAPISKSAARDCLAYEATLRAVEAERDAAENQTALRDEVIATLTDERDRYREALERIARWDMLSPGSPVADAPYMLRMVRDALATRDPEA